MRLVKGGVAAASIGPKTALSRIGRARSEVDAGRGIPDGRARCLFTLTGGNVASLVDYGANRSECDQTIRELGDRLADIWHVELPFLTEAGPENSPMLNSTAAKEVCSTIGH